MLALGEGAGVGFFVDFTSTVLEKEAGFCFISPVLVLGEEAGF
jgi:hypothetical protein